MEYIITQGNFNLAIKNIGLNVVKIAFSKKHNIGLYQISLTDLNKLENSNWDINWGKWYFTNKYSTNLFNEPIGEFVVNTKKINLFYPERSFVDFINKKVYTLDMDITQQDNFYPLDENVVHKIEKMYGNLPRKNFESENSYHDFFEFCKAVCGDTDFFSVADWFFMDMKLNINESILKNIKIKKYFYTLFGE